jgi:hypothetical protein
MSNYRSMIDQALEAARARSHTAIEAEKTASRPGSSLVKEAQEVASALEFVSLSATGGNRADGFRQEMIRDFYKSAMASPAQGATSTSGVQGVAPTEGKTRIAPKGLVTGNSPVSGSVTANTRDGEKPLRESFKQAGGQSLYDILMNNKTAGVGGPAESDAETLSGVTSANENSTYRATLHSNEGPVLANKRNLKKSTRARLAEAFAHVGDTLGDASAAQIFPLAARMGHLKDAAARVKKRMTPDNINRLPADKREKIVDWLMSSPDSGRLAFDEAMDEIAKNDPDLFAQMEGFPAEIPPHPSERYIPGRVGRPGWPEVPAAAVDMSSAPASVPAAAVDMSSAPVEAAETLGRSMDAAPNQGMGRFLTRRNLGLAAGAAGLATAAGVGAHLYRKRSAADRLRQMQAEGVQGGE